MKTFSALLLCCFLTFTVLGQQTFNQDILIKKSSPVLTLESTSTNVYGGILFRKGTNNRWILDYGTSNTDNLRFVKYTSNTAFQSVLFMNYSSGNVGIGTENPSNYKLAVNGTIRAKEVRVNTNWSDFVFDKEYTLPTLAEVEAHIKQHKHLPSIPSAAEVEAEGVELGTISSKLLQKIEELTLYVIAQEKRSTAQEKRIQALEAENKALKE